MRNPPRSTVLVLAAVLATALVPLVNAAGDDEAWRGYLETKKGERLPLPSRVVEVKDKDWLAVRYTDYTGYKPRLGVVVSEEKSVATQEYRSEWARLLSSLSQGATNPFNHIEDMVRQSIGATNRFTMVERTNAIDDVLDEQDFGASGRVDKKTSAKIGKVKGAQYAVKATIIELNPEKEAKDIKAVAGGLGSAGLLIGSFGISGKVAFCRLNVRVINSETSEILQDMTVDGTAKSTGLTLGGGMIAAMGGGLGGAGVGSSNKKEAAISDAMQACANKIAHQVALKFEDVPWEGAVALVSRERITINGGTNVGLKAGTILTLFAKGEELRDPETDELLGFETSEIGTLRVVSAQEKFATCEVIDGGDGVKKGDIVRLAKVQ